jgi:ATPase subunit of ABC transporter with duplicated ATPase domains
MAIEEGQEKARQSAITAELDWVRQNAKGRQSKSKARLKAFDELVKESNSRTLENAQIVIPAGPRLGDVVLQVQNVSKAFEGRTLIDNLTFSLPAGGIVGIVGPNGAGKTTLFKMITGAETPDSGTFRVGETVKLGCIDQTRDALDDSKSVWENISNGAEVIDLGGREVKSRAYVSSFNFKKDMQQQLVGNLSGGQRNRVHLARMLRTGVNLLLLDEPTNDLDVETLRALEDALLSFPGCAVVISHDRYFLDRIATHILAYEGNGHVEWFEGNFEEYLEDKKRRLGDDYLQEQNRKFKKIA